VGELLPDSPPHPRSGRAYVRGLPGGLAVRRGGGGGGGSSGKVSSAEVGHMGGEGGREKGKAGEGEGEARREAGVIPSVGRWAPPAAQRRAAQGAARQQQRGAPAAEQQGRPPPPQHRARKHGCCCRLLRAATGCCPAGGPAPLATSVHRRAEEGERAGERAALGSWGGWRAQRARQAAIHLLRHGRASWLGRASGPAPR
jgi:hypothetical protein